MNKDLKEAQRVLEIEARAILALKDRLNADFERAVELLIQCRGKVVVTGMGKSGQVGRKIASTMSSTGTPSIFVHPADSSHGDLGALGSEDLILAISYSGETPELQAVLKFAARKGNTILAMTGNMKSTLAQAADIALDVHVDEEACPLGLAPTASTTVTLALGDALAVALLQRRGFREGDFAEFHPGGSLGRKLLTRVSDLMHKGEALPIVKTSEPMRQVLTLMTQREVRGIAGVVDDNGVLIGVITDGDIRRRLEKSLSPLDETAQDLMAKNPKTIDLNELAEKALFMMEQFRIQTLCVVDRSSATPGCPVGMIQYHDLLQAKIR